MESFKPHQRILIVDADPVSLDSMCQFASDCDAKVQTSTGLDGAIRRINENRFNTVIVDWQLPNEEAMQLVQHIRSNHRLRRTHIIALSEPADPEIVQTVLKAGVDDFFARPVTSGEVRTRLLWAQSRAMELV
jgi:DNA-binding response OmpR family regulator